MALFAAIGSRTTYYNALDHGDPNANFSKRTEAGGGSVLHQVEGLVTYSQHVGQRAVAHRPEDQRHEEARKLPEARARTSWMVRLKSFLKL